MPRTFPSAPEFSPLLALLLSENHSGEIAILPGSTHPVASAVPAGKRNSRRALLGVPLLLAARAVLRRPRVRQFVLQILKRSPSLYGRAYRTVMQSGTAAGGHKHGDDAGLSAHAAVILRVLHTPRQTAPPTSGRRRLALVTPLPPERTGIAAYALELLAELSHTFDIEVVVAQADVALPPTLAGIPVRSGEWLALHGDEYDHILYQFGNSPFHSHMFALLARYPGVVVLHDFFLGGALVHAQMSGALPHAWRTALLHGHGYSALRASAMSTQHAQAHKEWPASLCVLEAATRVVVHSQHARQLAIDWYGTLAASNIDVIPHPRTAPPLLDRAAARAALGIAGDCYLVCSFGFIAPNKLTLELLRAWIGSELHRARGCALVLVGANHDSPYGVEVDALIRADGPTTNIRIAGWTDNTVYRQYLQAADAGVQLRTNAHGESSGAVLDCLNYGLPTIVNANGTMAEFPSDTVWRLPDLFDIKELSAALEALWHDPAQRAELGRRAVALLDAHFRPGHCAQLYRATLDRAIATTCTQHAAWRAARDSVPPHAAQSMEQLAIALGQALPSARRQLLVDISEWAGANAPPDVMAQHQVRELLEQECAGLHIEPVWLDTTGAEPCYRYARTVAARLLGLEWPVQPDAVADVHAGDVFYAPDAASPLLRVAYETGLLCGWRARGIAVNVLVRGPLDEAAMRAASCADRLLYVSEQAATDLAAH